MKRKFKKPATPSKKRTLVIVEEEEPELAKKVKKAPTKAERRKGIELLYDAALLEEAQLKKDLKRSKRETNIDQAGGLSEGADFESKVPDEPKGKSIDTSEGTCLKPGVSNVSKDSENQETNDDEEETEDEFVHTPLNYVPTHDIILEEYERTNEELYGDVNVSFTDVEPVDKEKDDEEMIVAGHVNINKEGASNQVKDDAQVTQKTEVTLSSSISSNYAAKFLNFDNIPLADTEVISMFDINVQHEVSRTTSLLTIHVSVIPEQDVINQSETVTTTPAPTIYSLLSSIYHAL
ncbi:hypothetical protein Tco_1014202 [Tanacetum coccineum]